MKKISLVAISLMIAAGAPAVSQAKGSCSSSILLYSWNSADQGFTSLYTSQLQCLIDPSQDAGDGHFIHPAADTIQVGFNGQGITAPTLTGSLTGLGFSDRRVTLLRGDEVVAGTGVYIYLSEDVALPGGATSSGCLTIELEDPVDAGEALDYNEFHTLDSSCP